MGPRVKEFEQAFQDRLGADFAMVDSGSNALHLAIAAMRLPPGSEVVLPAFTWVACANAVLLAGQRPAFADVELETGNLDPVSVEQARTPDTRAIMVVHYAGKPAQMAGLAEFGLPIIEDAAHAVDSRIDGRCCGTIGAAGIFSFDAVKNLATPDGGGLTSTSDELMERARALRYCGVGASAYSRREAGGRWWEQEVLEPFPRAIPNDVSASVGLAQLAKLEAHQRRRREVWETYQRELADLDWLARPPEAAQNERHSYFTYLVRVLDGRRDALAATLLEAGVYTTLRYHPLHLSPAFGHRRRLPNCELLAEQGLNLPLHPALADSDLERVIEVVRGF
jgi:aminotransferase